MLNYINTTYPIYRPIPQCEWFGLWAECDDVTIYLNNNEQNIELELKNIRTISGDQYCFIELSKYAGCRIVGIEGSTVDATTPFYYYKANETDINDWKRVVEFAKIATKNKSLGNFIYDFSYFDSCKMLKYNQYNDILQTLEIDMAYNNMWLKCYEPLYWRNYSYVYLYIQEAKTILENLQVARINNNEADINKFEAEYNNKLQAITSVMKNLYDKSICTNFGIWDSSKFIPDIVNHNPFQNDIDILSQVVNEYQAYKIQLQQCQSYINSTDISSLTGYELQQAQAELEYYTSTYYTLLSVVGDLTESDDNPYSLYEYEDKREYEDNSNVKLPARYLATYPTLIIDIYNILLKINESDTIYKQILKYQAVNKMLWTNLYNKYGDFILESEYENTDEFDSISLYNAAIAEFQNRNKPNLNVSLGILDLSVLEAIGETQLQVNSKIKIYDPDLNFGENDTKNILSYTGNELIVDTLNYDLRNAGQVAITVEQLVPYRTILQKLIQSVN